MEYKVVVVSAVKGFGTNFEKAAEELAQRVNEQIEWGWVPHGGVAVGETQSMKEPHLLQAMVKS